MMLYIARKVLLLGATVASASVVNGLPAVYQSTRRGLLHPELRRLCSKKEQTMILYFAAKAAFRGV